MFVLPGQAGSISVDTVWSKARNPVLLKPVNPVTFNASTLENYRKDSRFAYSLPPEQRPSLLQLILLKLQQWLYSLFGNRGVANFFLGLLIFVFILGLGWTLFVLFGGSTSNILYQPEKSKLDYSVEREDLDKIDFMRQIDVALQDQSYRKAIRLIYLYAIKLLSNQALIEPRPWKTNHDYLYELKSQKLKDDLSELNYYFDYVWYGDFTADKPLCDQALSTIRHLKQNLPAS